VSDERRWTIWTCSYCGYAPGSRRNWCNAGCGSDYNRMEPVEVVPASEVERLRSALQQIVDAESGPWGWIAHEALRGSRDG
jgi:hypothetical protein